MTMRKRMALALPLVGAAALWFFLLRPAFLGGPASYIMVSGPSMEPALHHGDLAVVRKQGSYSPGDIVPFRVPKGEPGEGAIVIHRIAGGTPEEGFVVQGDNKDAPDIWRPTPGDIVGKVWLHVPGAGRLLALLRDPLNLGLMVGGLTTLSLLGGGEVKPRRKGGRRMPSGTGNKTGGRLPAPVGVMVALGAFAVLALALAAGAVYSFRQPAEKSQLVERLRYEHTAAFDYTAQVEASSLYPSGVIQPVTPPAPGLPATAEATTAVPAQPIYTKLARSLDLGFTYALESFVPPEVQGELSAALQIRAGDGWVQTLEVLPPTPFGGSTTSARIPVDFGQVWSLIDTIEQETGFTPGTYDVSVIPTVRITGRIGTETVDELYSPAFTMKLNRTQITPDPELARSEVKTVADTVSESQHLNLLGLSIPVTMTRWVSVGGAVMALAAAAALAGVVFLGLGRTEAAKIQARYGSLLISVAQADLKDEAQRIELASMHDLVKLAQRDSRIIFHQDMGTGSHLYFVQDGTVTYQYTVAEPATED